MSEERNEIMFGESSNVVTKKHMKASTKRKIGSRRSHNHPKRTH